jgi:hypothetical protein
VRTFCTASSRATRPGRAAATSGQRSLPPRSASAPGGSRDTGTTVVLCSGRVRERETPVSFAKLKPPAGGPRRRLAGPSGVPVAHLGSPRSLVTGCSINEETSAMAVHRIPTHCHACMNPILLRIVIAGGEQLTCPHCHSELRGRFFARPDEPYTFRSDDLILQESDPDHGLAIMVATDLPVHTESWGTPVDEIFKSPFFHLMWSIGNEPIVELMPKIEAMRHLREYQRP